MNLLEVYAALRSNRIDEKGAANAFGVSVRSLRFAMSRHGARFPGLLATLDAIRNDEITRDEAAENLGVSVRQVNNLMLTWKVKRPLRTYLVRRKVSEMKWEIRKTFAIEYISGKCSIEEAAEEAEVSSRQMRRWVSDLLHEHFGLKFVDLKRLSDGKRERLAREIEAAESLDLARQQALKALLRQKKSLEETAIDQLLSKKHHV
jgi:hypothetical protein